MSNPPGRAIIDGMLAAAIDYIAGRCPVDSGELEPEYGPGGPAGELGTFRRCVKCSRCYDFKPDPEPRP